MTLKDLKHLVVFCVLVALSTIVMFAEDTLDKRQDDVISQGAYFYGMSHLLKEDNAVVASVKDESGLEEKAFFWGVKF